MQCDVCGNEATHHETVVRGGAGVQRHLCEACARKQGLGAGAGPAVQAIQKAMTQAALSAAAEQLASAALACPACGLRLPEFRESGRLGCARCYEAFEVHLAPLIGRAHEGATHHTGRVSGAGAVGGVPVAPSPAGPQGRPRRPAMSVPEARRRLEILRRELAAAVAGEQYERAAALRDQMTKLEAVVRAAGPGGAA